MRRFRFRRSNQPGTMAVYESPDRPGWKVVALTGSMTMDHVRALAEQMLRTAESGIPELVVDTREVMPPVGQLAAVLHRSAALLSGAGGALIVTDPPPGLVKHLQSLGDSQDLVLVA